MPRDSLLSVAEPSPSAAAPGLSARSAAALGEPRIRIRGLDFYYGANKALKGINLDLPERQVTGMIGPSGCGKSTLLRVLNRMYDLYPGQRAEGEVLLDQRNIIGGDVDLNELRDRVHTSAMGLSGGQQQRLCIARTIAVRPEVILLDEPTSALDPISTLKVEELIDELKQDFTLAIVTHNMQQAARCADQVAFFYLGELVEVGPAAQMFTAPKQKKTQEYITGRFG